MSDEHFEREWQQWRDFLWGAIIGVLIVCLVVPPLTERMVHFGRNLVLYIHQETTSPAWPQNAKIAPEFQLQWLDNDYVELASLN